MRLAASKDPLSTPLVARVTSVSMPPPMTYLAARLPSSLAPFLVALGVNNCGGTRSAALCSIPLASTRMHACFEDPPTAQCW